LKGDQAMMLVQCGRVVHIRSIVNI